MRIRRVYICAHAAFPHNGAGANYIYNLARCLMEIGAEIYIFSRGKNYKEDWNENKKTYMYEGIFYYNHDKGNNKISFIKDYFICGKKVVETLKRYEVASDDMIIIYGINYWYIKKIIKYGKECGAKIFTCAMEHHQVFQYKGGYFNPIFWLEKIGFEYGVPLSRNVIVVSRYLQKYFADKKCRTIIVPPLVDAEKIVRREKIKNEKARFIYSGDPFRKDSVEVMLKSLLYLEPEYRNRLEFHFSGCKEEKIKSLSRLNDKEWMEVRKNLTIHTWMEYQELIQLYQEMDFLLIARYKNKVTIANFPSKVPELMSYGVIPVVSRVGDYTDIYLKNKENSIIFENCTVGECAGALKTAIELKEDELMKLSQNAQSCVKEKFDYHNVAKRLWDFIEGE